MQTKEYQQQTLDQLGAWLEAVNEARQERAEVEKVLQRRGKPLPPGMADFPGYAWSALKGQGGLPQVELDQCAQANPPLRHSGRGP